MKIERDERRFDFRDIGLAIKRAREAAGMTQEQLAYIVDRAPRTIMYNENDGQHPSLNTFYQIVHSGESGPCCGASGFGSQTGHAPGIPGRRAAAGLPPI